MFNLKQKYGAVLCGSCWSIAATSMPKTKWLLSLSDFDRENFEINR